MEIKVFKRNVKMMHYCGLWPTASGPGSWWYLIPRITITFQLLEGIVVRIFDVCFNWSRMEYHDVCIVLLTSWIPLVFAVVNMTTIANMEATVDVVHKLEAIYENQHVESEYQRQVLVRTRKITHVTGYILPLAVMIGEFVGNVAPIPELLQLRKTLFRGWYPYDIKAAPNLELTVFGQALLGQTEFTIFIVIICLILTMFFVTEAQFNILHDKLRNMRAHSVAKLQQLQEPPRSSEKDGDEEDERLSRTMIRMCGKLFKGLFKGIKHVCCFLKYTKNRKDIVKVNTRRVQWNLQEVTAEEFDDASTSYSDNMLQHRTAESTHAVCILGMFRESLGKFRETIEEVEVTNQMREIDAEMDIRLKECIKLHQDLLSICKELEILFNPLFVGFLLSCVLPGGMAFLYSSLVPELDRNSLIFTAIAIIQIFIFMCFCWITDHLTHQCSLVKEATYGCDWFESTESFKRTIRIVITQANKPFIFQALSFLPMTMKTFEKMVQSAYSYYALLREATHL